MLCGGKGAVSQCLGRWDERIEIESDYIAVAEHLGQKSFDGAAMTHAHQNYSTDWNR